MMKQTRAQLSICTLIKLYVLYMGFFFLSNTIKTYMFNWYMFVYSWQQNIRFAHCTWPGDLFFATTIFTESLHELLAILFKFMPKFTGTTTNERFECRYITSSKWHVVECVSNSNVKHNHWFIELFSVCGYLFIILYGQKVSSRKAISYDWAPS